MNYRPETFSNGESRVLELATRLLSDEDPVARAVLKPRIFVGRLPEDMPVEIPIPDNFAMVGSLVRSEPDPHGEPTVEVVLDARMPAEQVRDAYRAQMSAAGWEAPEFESIIPHLEPPLGSYQWPGAGGGGTGDAYSTATLESDLDAAAIGAHYVGQLRDGGWSFSEEGYGGRQAWSGVFLALRLAGSPRRYFLFVHIIRTRDHHGSP
jgi:hypothetical protein